MAIGQPTNTARQFQLPREQCVVPGTTVLLSFALSAPWPPRRSTMPNAQTTVSRRHGLVLTALVVILLLGLPIAVWLDIRNPDRGSTRAGRPPISIP
jgi:hypothetical protein